jgi:hypothetical protein
LAIVLPILFFKFFVDDNLFSLSAFCRIVGQDCEFLRGLSIEPLKEAISLYMIIGVAIVWVAILLLVKFFSAARNKAYIRSTFNTVSEFITEFYAVLVGLVAGPVVFYFLFYIIGIFVPAFNVQGLPRVFLVSLPLIGMMVFFIILITNVSIDE